MFMKHYAPNRCLCNKGGQIRGASGWGGGGGGGWGQGGWEWRSVAFVKIQKKIFLGGGGCGGVGGGGGGGGGGGSGRRGGSDQGLGWGR